MKHKRVLAGVLSAVLICNTFATSIVTYAADSSLVNEMEVTNPQGTETQDETSEAPQGETGSEENVEKPVEEANKKETPVEKEETSNQDAGEASGEEQAETPESTKPETGDTTKEPEVEETETNEAEFNLEASVAELEKMIQSGEGGFSEVVGFLRDSEHFYEVFTGISEKTQKAFLKGLNKNQLYQFEQYAKYAFVDTMRAYEEKENLTKADVEKLASYVDVYGDLVKRSQKAGSIKPEKVTALDKEVFDTIISSLDEKIVKEKEISDFQNYGEYLQEISSFDVTEVLDGLNNFSCINPDLLPREVKEFKNFIYATYGFDELIEKVEEETKPKGKKKSVAKVDSKAAIGVDTSNLIEINMHDYEDADSAPNYYETLNSPINKNREFIFQYYRDDYQYNGGTRWWNNYFVDPNPTIPKKYQKGIVAPKLVDGYPVFSNEAKPGYSLDYLFNGQSSAGVINHYNNLNNLFFKDSDGTYHFSSFENQIVLQNDGTFEQYAQSDQNPMFLPLNKVTSRRNFWFGMDISTKFNIPENKKINGKDMVYEFSGDDDLWVFIDDVLVLDLGGIHSEISGSINFTTGTVTEGYVYASVPQDENSKVHGTRTHTIEESFRNAGKTWDSSVGSKHTMKVFYLERGYGGSTCAMSFNLPLRPITPESEEYTVRYDANGGSGYTASSTHTVGVRKNLTANGFYRDGYTFTGWNTDPYGYGTSYRDEEYVGDLSKNDGDIVTLYAQWTPNVYTVVYHGNGSTGGSTATSTHTFDESKTLTPNGFIKTGFSGTKYTFVGWATSPDGKPVYADEEMVVNLTDTPNGVVDLYAIWREDNNTFTVTYKPNGGLGSDLKQVVLPNQNWVTHHALFIKVGYVIESWNTSANGSGKRYELNATQSAISKDLILYAQYRPVEYTIKYHGNGATSGSTPDSFHTYGIEKALSKNGYKRDGYTFKGWTTTPPLSKGTLLPGERFNALIPSGITEIIFTDEEVPENAINPIDVSVEENQSIMAWTEAGTTTWKVSSLIPGEKVKANADCSFLLADFMFIRNVHTIDLENLDTSNVINMMNMFAFCRDLTTLDVSGFDTSNVTDMQGMFNNCKKLTSLDVSGFDTSNVKNMASMFDHCGALTTLNVSTFNTGNVTSMSGMFSFCYELQSLNITSFDTSNVNDMTSMFEKCRALTSIDLSRFNTSNVAKMSAMFEQCESITTLDLSGFDTSKVKWIMRMFKNCNNLKTIYVGQNWNMNIIIESYDMFTGCNSIVGQSGTSYSASNVNNVSMANWNFGYLTYKEFIPAISFFMNGSAVSSTTEKDFYKDQEVVVNLTDIDSKVINMYAVWEEKKVEDIVIVYDGNGNNSGTLKTEVVKGSDVLKDGYVVEKNEGFTSYKKKNNTFIGWHTDIWTPSYKAAYKESNLENKISYDELIRICEDQSSGRIKGISLSAKEKRALGVSADAPVATLYAAWDKAPELAAKDVLEFYEGETVTKEDLIKNISAIDREDLQQNIDLEDVRITKIQYAEGKIVNGEKQPAYEKTWDTDMADADLLDTWFLQMDKKDSPVTHTITFEVTDSVGNTTKLEWTIKVKYNEFPEIKAEERYFTLEEANSGLITEEELLDRVRAWDLEDCQEKPLKDHTTCNHSKGETCLDDAEKCAFAKKVELDGFDAEEFKTLTESAYIAVPCRVIDQFGKETMAQIGVYVSKDGETPEGPNARYVRFIDEKNYEKGLSTSESRAAETSEDGRLHAESKWYTEDAYKTLLAGTFDKTGASPLTFAGDELKEIQSKGESSGSPSTFYEKYVKDKIEK